MCAWKEATEGRERGKIDVVLVERWGGVSGCLGLLHSWALEVFHALQVANCFHGSGEDIVHYYRHHLKLQVERHR